MTGAVGGALQGLLDKEAIRAVIHRRARATDTGDVALSLSCYHPGATENHEGFDGPVDEYLRSASPALVSDSPVEKCFHLVGNIEIDVDVPARRATSQTYFICVLTARDAAGTRTDYLNAGRYLDDFSERDSEWAIDRRVCEYDWGRSDRPSVRWWERPA